ncbi:hypothetical protein PIB30_014920, partial [Stylosanthes scabra]|nr:hypothetical protein [Stylosanthes scabra]
MAKTFRFSPLAQSLTVALSEIRIVTKISNSECRLCPLACSLCVARLLVRCCTTSPPFCLQFRCLLQEEKTKK